jgi:hypothetical protein
MSENTTEEVHPPDPKKAATIVGRVHPLDPRKAAKNAGYPPDPKKSTASRADRLDREISTDEMNRRVRIREKVAREDAIARFLYMFAKREKMHTTFDVSSNVFCIKKFLLILIKNYKFLQIILIKNSY